MVFISDDCFLNNTLKVEIIICRRYTYCMHCIEMVRENQFFQCLQTHVTSMFKFVI